MSLQLFSSTAYLKVTDFPQFAMCQ